MNNTVYNQEFYDCQWRGSMQSARICLADLFKIWKPKNVIDIGCGVGSWFAACDELGVDSLTGTDGPWISHNRLSSPRIKFFNTYFRTQYTLHGRYDLAISLEVAEHLPVEVADHFVNAIMGAAGAVIFSAACIGQPGDDHINSQWQSYWAKKFTAAGFLIYDFFRPTHWMNGQVEPWYQQNMLLFVRPIHELAIAFKSAGIQPLENPAFVDLVHPWLYDLTLQKATHLEQKLIIKVGASPKRGITRILSFVRHLHRRA